MADRYDLRVSKLLPSGKYFNTKIGSAWPKKDIKTGEVIDGFDLSFDALPIPQLNDKGELKVQVHMWTPYEDADKQKAPPPKAEELDDEIPF